MVPPFFNKPDCSASKTMLLAARSLTEPLTDMNSALAYILQPVCSDRDFKYSKGVLPIESSSELLLLLLQELPWLDLRVRAEAYNPTAALAIT